MLFRSYVKENTKAIYIEDKGDDQFEISDGRNVEEVYNALLSNNLQPVMSDYIYV